MGNCIAAADTNDSGNFTHQPVKEFEFKKWVTGLTVSPDKSTVAIGWGTDNIVTAKTAGWGDE